MTDAPEKIWAKYSDQVYDGKRGLLIDNVSFDGCAEFLRSDLAEAQIAAVCEVAAQLMAKGLFLSAQEDADAIRALTPSSAKTALDALLQAERCEATHTVSYHGPDGESGDFVFSSLDEASAFTSALRKMPGFQVVDHVERAMSTAQSAIAAIRNINEGEG